MISCSIHSPPGKALIRLYVPAVVPPLCMMIKSNISCDPRTGKAPGGLLRDDPGNSIFRLLLHFCLIQEM